MKRGQAAAEGRRSLDRLLSPHRAIPIQRPARGWVRAIRDALGMTAEQLGARIGVSQPTVHKLERSEQDGTVQLNTLRRAAEALDCELVYVFVPRKPLRETYEARARAVALGETAAIGHTMSLEAQSVDDEDAEAQLRRFIEDDLNPRELWNRP